MSETPALNSDHPPLVLIIDDESRERSLLTACLMHAGYRVVQAASGCRGLEEFSVQQPDAIVLDLDLADVGGAEIIRQLRERSRVPIVALSGGEQPGQENLSRQTGADDVIAKPVQITELLARLGRLVRMLPGAGNEPAARFQVGDLHVDLAAQRVFVAEREILLSATEFTLLATLSHHAGRVVTYRFLTNQLWNSNAVLQIAFLKLLVSSLRHKLEPDPIHPRYVLTERGTGYRLAVE